MSAGPGPSYGGGYPPHAGQPSAYAAQVWAAPARPRSDYASWGRRVAAMLIDHAPSYVALAVFYSGYIPYALQLSTTAVLQPTGPTLVLLGVGTLLLLAALGWNVANRWLRAGRTGQSLGRRLLGIHLVSDQYGVPIGPLNAFLRDLVHLLDGIAYVGYLWPLWDAKRQTFADKLLTTVVVNGSRPQG